MIKLLHMEWLRLRRFCLVLPVAAALFLLGMTGGLWYLNYMDGPGGVFSIFSVQYFFLSMTVMLSITILASVTAATEHEAGGWKMLGVLPVPKPNILISKFIVVFVLVTIEVLLIIAGTASMWRLATHETIPWDIMVKQPAYCLLAACAFMSIQVWLSAVVANQSIPIGLGVAGSISSLFLARSDLDIVHYMPWTYPALASPLIADHLSWVAAGVATGIVVLAAGAWHFRRMEW